MNCDALVIGAGVSGLAAARELTAAGKRVILLDRANGVGGRCATKSLHGQRVDFGVPYLHGATPHFLGVLESLLTESADPAGVLPGWPTDVLGPTRACQPASFNREQRRLAIREGVSAFPKRLARGLDVRLGVLIRELRALPNGVEALAADGRRFNAPRVVLALAGPQSTRLLETVACHVKDATEVIEKINALEQVACLTVIAGYENWTPAPPWQISFPLETTINHCLIHDSSKRDDPPQRVMVYQARPRFSAQCLDVPEEEWSRDIVWEAGEILGDWAARPVWTYNHRWRWARLRPGQRAYHSPRWLDVETGGKIGICGDGMAPANGVEGAFLSGVAVARDLPWS